MTNDAPYLQNIMQDLKIENANSFKMNRHAPVRDQLSKVNQLKLDSPRHAFTERARSLQPESVSKLNSKWMMPATTKDLLTRSNTKHVVFDTSQIAPASAMSGSPSYVESLFKKDRSRQRLASLKPSRMTSKQHTIVISEHGG